MLKLPRWIKLNKCANNINLGSPFQNALQIQNALL